MGGERCTSMPFRNDLRPQSSFVDVVKRGLVSTAETHAVQGLFSLMYLDAYLESVGGLWLKTYVI